MLRSVLALQRDPDPAVRLQLALTLGESRSPSALDALVFLAASFGNERWMETAIASSAAETAPELLARLLRRREGVGSARSVVDLLSQTIGARQRPEEVAGFLETLADLDESPAPPLNLQAECLRGLAKGLRRGKSVRLDDAGGMRALTRLLASSRAPVRTAAFEVVGGLELADASFLREVFERSAREASDASLEVEPRLAALRLLAHAPFASRRATCKELLQPQHAVDLQLAAVAALSDADDAMVGELLLSGWRGYSPRVREAVLDAIFARQNRLPHLLTALESELVEPGTVTSFRRTRLLESDDEELGRRARAVFDDRSRTRFVNDETFERFAAALGRKRDLVRGGQLFEEHCASCHRAGEKGHAVGPDLASERERADETLLNDMLAPSSQITAGYSAYIAITNDGRALTGVLTSESATSLTLRQANAVEESVLRKNIRTLSVSSVSLMPENFAELFKPEDAADIIAYLRSTFGDVLPVSVTLFDEEEDFVDRLDRGDGVARIVTDDVHSGKHALTVTPLQRHSPRIPNWDYRIAEKPRPGEYRYLRLAWKTTGGDGVLIELAASGGWPPAESATRRYYSGANTTKWRAHEVSKKVPTEWTVMTVDLWKDNGAFTLTGIAPTACGGVAHFDRIELLRSVTNDE